MCKEPVMGRVKTRLGRDIGMPTATGAYRQMLNHVAARLSCSRRWQTLLAVAPVTGIASRMLPVNLVRRSQGPGDLGTKLQYVVDHIGSGAIVIIGTDIPGIRVQDIEAAFRLLGSHDAVFGPAPDGGYWLVGLKRRPVLPRVFSHVRWSSPHALEDTIRNLAGRQTGEVASHDDVDSAADYARLAPLIGRRILPRG